MNQNAAITVDVIFRNGLEEISRWIGDRGLVHERVLIVLKIMDENTSDIQSGIGVLRTLINSPKSS